MTVSCVPVENDHNLTWSLGFEFCPLYIPFSEACIWLETRDPLSPRQWVCGAEWPGLEYRVWGSRGGRESAGQVGAWHPLLQNSFRAHYHPRYYSHHPCLSIHTHTHQPQYTKASTVTRKGSITWILDCNQVLIQSSLAVGSDMKHRSLSVCCRSCIVFVLSLLVQLVTKWKNVWYCWREKQGLYHFLKAMNSYMYYFGLFSGFKMRRDSTVSHMWMSTNSEMQTKCFSHE